MSEIRPQYHFRPTATGLDAWDVRRLVGLSRELPVQTIDPGDLPGLDEGHWYLDPATVPSPRDIVEHIRLIQACDLSYPIILDAQGRVMDGMHRVCKALLEGIDAIPAVQFIDDPAPDYVDCTPAELPYDE